MGVQLDLLAELVHYLFVGEHRAVGPSDAQREQGVGEDRDVSMNSQYAHLDQETD